MTTGHSLLAALFVALLTVGKGNAQDGQNVPVESDSETVQSDVRQMSAALYRGDVDSLLRFTHPEIVKALGGEPAARDALNQAVRQFQAIGMTLDSLVFPESPKFVSGNGRLFAIVPMESIISANNQKVQSLNFQFGVREADSVGWKYVEGSRLNKEILGALFPDFPPDYAFPPVARKKL